MKSQFMHVELYSREEPAKKTINKSKNLNHQSDVRTTTVGGVLSEMKREEGFTSHLEQVNAPQVLYGSISDLERSIERYEAEFKTTDKNGKEKKLRKDACILLAGVVSLDRADEEIWDEYKTKSIEYLKNKYGENLKCVVEHTDETNPHFHFYVVGNQKQDLNLLHDGKLAVSKLAKEDKKKLHQTAYTEAMIKFQDDFYAKVSNKFGLSRTGEEPRERYKSRPDYLRFKKRQETALNILANLEEFEEKEFEKAKTRGLNIGIKDFDQNTFLGKLDWRVKRIKKEKDNEIKKLSDENDNLNIDKSNLQHELDMSKIELSDAYNQRNEASRKNSVYIDKVNALKKENKLLLPYKDQFDLKLKQEKEPLQAEVKELTSENNNLKNENSELKKENLDFKEFILGVKNYYGSKFDEWCKEIFKTKTKYKY
ncbi:plasmid recombination protein [Escherichia coli]|uniref:plasmid recombination protein n=6 Tax=Enterobacteriaceae TaxID=543 RepID=UPI0023F7794B|nr:plasmid recombination protein [Escherichia coli]MDF7497398.1 plasmid recombination protein [Escherichia coli]MDF7502245.1 plasmid recombination protein [Escherichia coli]MDF7511594.1 plasmid recombination protein [Escherichia coli]MDF7521111.1 plasmid recombination protein [Escherichia coli]MDF7544916.1 plasmid recombination protein [Escherichia coli]